jgi:hypothetical protein
MRVRLTIAITVITALVGCGGSHPDLCATVDPQPIECMESCDPRPGVPPTCPNGFHCTPDGVCDFQCTAGGNECGSGNRCTIDGRCIGANDCEGLECDQVDDCPTGTTTSLSGVVYAPNGTLPLYNVNVYVPNAPIAPFENALTCDQCGDELSGLPLVRTLTDTEGRFTLLDVPATDNVPLVIQVGRWRRLITVPTVTECVDTAVDQSQTRFARNQSEGDIPRIALSTGSADALECLLRKIGLDDSEFGTAGAASRVHLYSDFDATNSDDGRGTGQFDNGTPFADSQTLWNDVASLSNYDITVLSCEGAQHPETKSAGANGALAAMKTYADLGGRVFASHWHNIWLDSAPTPWPDVIERTNGGDLGSVTANVNQNFDRGAALADWLVNVNASTTLGQIQLEDAKNTIQSVDTTQVDTWIDVPPDSVQYLSFTTPLEQPLSNRCGRVVFSDIHVSTGDNSGNNLSFPSDGCTTSVTNLTPQEKVLVFMIFDIASCIPDVID